jgi:hypothetical protein
MSKAFDSISKALRQAIAHQRGKRVRGMRLHVPGRVAVKEVRWRPGLTQEQFAVKSPNAVTIAAMREAFATSW